MAFLLRKNHLALQREPLIRTFLGARSQQQSPIEAISRQKRRPNTAGLRTKGLTMNMRSHKQHSSGRRPDVLHNPTMPWSHISGFSSLAVSGVSIIRAAASSGSKWGRSFCRLVL